MQLNKKFFIFLFAVLALLSVNLAVFAEGTEESPVGDYIVSYSSEGDTLIIKNTRAVDTVSITAQKQWSDADDQDGIRPREIKLQLQADGVDKGLPEVVTVGDDGTWSYTWEGLPANRDQGIPIVYTVKEAEEIDGYTSSVSEDGLTVTNHHEPETYEIKVEWEWVDDNDRDGVRPDMAEVSVFLGDTHYGDVTVSRDDTSSGTVTVPKYTPGQSGVPAVYQAKIKTLDSKYTDVEGIPSEEGALKLEGHYEPLRTKLSTVKAWDDGDNQDGKRPSSVTYALVTDTVQGDPVTVNASDSPDFAYEWDNLYKYRDHGTEIQYSIVELNPGAYTPSYRCEKTDDGVECETLNSYNPSIIDLPLTWIWDDDSDRDGKRQDTVVVEVFIGDYSVGTITFVGSEPQETKTISVPEFEPGKEGIPAVYTFVIRDLIDEYSDAINDSDPRNTIIIASYEPEKVSVKTSKAWEDGNNQDGMRPTTVKYALVTDGVPGEPVSVSSDISADYSYTWTDLYKYHDHGTAYVYSVEEVEPGAYTPSYECTEQPYGTSCVVTNTLEPETKDLTLTFEWDDENDRDGKRQDTVTVEVYLGDELVGTIEFSGDEPISSKTISVPAYTPGQEGVPAEYTYVVTNLHDEYSDTLDNTDKDNPKIIASYIPEKTSVSATKVWNDNNNQDGQRPDTVTYALVIDSVQQEAVVVPSNSVKVWSNLYKYHDGGIAYNYSVVELDHGNYTPTYECTTLDNGSTDCVITNSREAENQDITINWIWDDDSDRDGKRQDTVTVDVYIGDELVGTVTIPGGSDTSSTTISVPKYTPGQEGVPAEYTYVIRDLHSEYEDTLDNSDKTSPTFIASYDPEKVIVSVNKTWEDDGNRDGIRPANVTWQLMRDGSPEGEPVTLQSDSSSYTWTNLYKYHDHGQKYEYSVKELNIAEGYEAEYSYEATEDGVVYSVTNNHNIEKLNVTPKIVWEDDNDRDNLRPETLTIRIIADSVATEYTFTTDEEEEWKHLFENLPKYKDGHEINYEFEIIDTVNDYTYHFEDTWTIVYVHKPERVSYTATVEWYDNDDIDRLRPESVQIQLYANGEPYGEPVTVLDCEGKRCVNWTARWDDLLRYIDGEPVTYIARQVEDLRPDYTTETEDIEYASIIKNYHDREVKDVNYIIIWDDASNLDGLRPEEIEVIIKLLDERFDSMTVETYEDEHRDSFTDVPANIDGSPAEYEVELAEVPNRYEVTYDKLPDGTTVITLKYRPGDIVQKSILNKDGKRWSDGTCYEWEELTVQLDVTNNGQSTLFNVRVRDRIPEGAELVFNSAQMMPAFADDRVTGTISDRVNVLISVLAPGERRTITYKVKAKDPTVLADRPAYFDFGNFDPVYDEYAPDPEYKSNTVRPCKWPEPEPIGPGQPTELPKTGFAPNIHTKLGPAKVNYQAYNQLRIRIPKLGVDAEILGVPYTHDTWDVTWLGENVGWLQNTKYPIGTSAGNSVLTGHLTNNFGYPGVFSRLETLGYGDEIQITAFGETYTYIVDETMTVYHDTPQVLSQNVDLPILTLITCKFYNESTGTYDGRVVVKAKLSRIS